MPCVSRRHCGPAPTARRGLPPAGAQGDRATERHGQARHRRPDRPANGASTAQGSRCFPVQTRRALRPALRQATLRQAQSTSRRTPHPHIRMAADRPPADLRRSRGKSRFHRAERRMAGLAPHPAGTDNLAPLGPIVKSDGRRMHRQQRSPATEMRRIASRPDSDRDTAQRGSGCDGAGMASGFTGPDVSFSMRQRAALNVRMLYLPLASFRQPASTSSSTSDSMPMLAIIAVSDGAWVSGGWNGSPTMIRFVIDQTTGGSSGLSSWQIAVEPPSNSPSRPPRRAASPG